MVNAECDLCGEGNYTMEDLLQW